MSSLQIPLEEGTTPLRASLLRPSAVSHVLAAVDCNCSSHDRKKKEEKQENNVSAGEDAGSGDERMKRVSFHSCVCHVYMMGIHSMFFVIVVMTTLWGCFFFSFSFQFFSLVSPFSPFHYVNLCPTRSFPPRLPSR